MKPALSPASTRERRRRKTRRKATPRAERKVRAGTLTGRCLRTDWQTPPAILEGVRACLGGRIPLDVATSPTNPTGADSYCSPVVMLPGPGPDTVGEWRGDGLLIPWTRRWYCNPPYGRAIKAWLAKIETEAARAARVPGVALLPCARWEQPYFTRVLRIASAGVLIRGRVRFRNPDTGDLVNGNPYANMVLGFNLDPQLLADAFRERGGERAGERGPCFTLQLVVPTASCVRCGGSGLWRPGIPCPACQPCARCAGEGTVLGFSPKCAGGSCEHAWAEGPACPVVRIPCPACSGDA